jgi:hypothetical protein
VLAVVHCDSFEQARLSALARRKHARGALFVIQPQLPELLGRSVTPRAMGLEDRLDVPHKINGRGLRLGLGGAEIEADAPCKKEKDDC